MRLNRTCRSLLSAGLFLFAVAGSLSAEDVVIELPREVSGIDDFVSYRDSVADTPEGGAAVFVLAMLLFESDQELGRQAMTVALDRSQLRESDDGYQGFAPGRQAKELFDRYLLPRPYLARSYLLGTRPEESYLAEGLRQVGVSQHRYSVIAEDRVKVFVESTGAASARPLTLQRNNRGIWKAYEYSSLFVGVAPPPDPTDDSL